VRDLILPLLLACTIPSIANAQTVIRADKAQVEPQVRRDQIGFSSCGFHAVVLVLNESARVTAYDFSMMVSFDTLHGATKAGTMSFSVSDLAAEKWPQVAVTPRPVRFWIAEESSGSAIYAIKSAPAESEGYLLGITEFVPTLRAIKATVEGKTMQFAIRYKRQLQDSIISFSHGLTEENARPLAACLSGLIGRIEAEANNRNQSESEFK
jgi:hypothetical protein